MRFGNITGLIDKSMTVIYDSGIIQSSLSSITITGLDGDADEQYQLLIYSVRDATSITLKLAFNGDTDSNYGKQVIRAYETTIDSFRATDRAPIMVASGANRTFTSTIINARSGAPRTYSTDTVENVNGTSINTLMRSYNVWNNTTDNITSMVLTATSGSIGAGSRIILLKKASGGMKVGRLEMQGSATGQWEKIGQFNPLSYLESADSSDWDIFENTTDDWTIDFWFRLNDPYIEPLISHQEDDANGWMIFYYNNNGTEGLTFNLRQNDTDLIAAEYGNGIISDTDLHHCALIKKGNEYGLYLDGTQIRYVQSNSTATFNATLKIGNNSNGTTVNGDMDEIRIYKGNPFNASPNSGKTDIITVPTESHTSDSNTKLLLHGEDFVDDSPSNHVITNHFVTSDSIAGKFGKGFRFGDDAAVAEVIFNSLNGDEDSIYLIVGNVMTVDGECWPIIQFNGDTASDSYGFQGMQCYSTSTLNAYSGTHPGMINCYGHTVAGNVMMFTSLIYVHSGYERIGINYNMQDVDSTSIRELNFTGVSWKNTSDNITSMKIKAASSGNGKYSQKTNIAIYRLKL